MNILLILMEMNKLKDIRLNQYLMNKKLMKTYSPYADTDKDGFINMMDCYPFDKNRHGWLGDTWRKVKGVVIPKTPTPPPTWSD